MGTFLTSYKGTFSQSRDRRITCRGSVSEDLSAVVVSGHTGQTVAHLLKHRRLNSASIARAVGRGDHCRELAS
jgi:hypothetical protein